MTTDKRINDLAGTALSRQFSSELLEKNNKISTEKEFAIQSHPDRKFIRLIHTPKTHFCSLVEHAINFQKKFFKRWRSIFPCGKIFNLIFFF